MNDNTDGQQNGCHLLVCNLHLPSQLHVSWFSAEKFCKIWIQTVRHTDGIPEIVSVKKYIWDGGNLLLFCVLTNGYVVGTKTNHLSGSYEYHDFNETVL